MQNIQPCDIIFVYNVNSNLEQLIATCGLNYGNSLINHVALCINSTTAIQATFNGVNLCNINSFTGNIYLKRPQQYISKYKKQKIIHCAKQYLGYGYNHTYHNNQKNIYCSELVINAFNNAGVKNIFTKHPITFNNHKTNKLDPQWLQFYASVNDIPQGELGSHPNHMFNNKKLKLVAKKITL